MILYYKLKLLLIKNKQVIKLILATELFALPFIPLMLLSVVDCLSVTLKNTQCVCVVYFNYATFWVQNELLSSCGEYLPYWEAESLGSNPGICLIVTVLSAVNNIRIKLTKTGKHKDNPTPKYKNRNIFRNILWINYISNNG